ncbi:L,D-transpeptidase [Neisseria sp. Ec49-e6-T10]|uniref:L,D-transpeptidase n=1 Tax=Neisseria sp. Ec49-e6-T10 TaxID=3140744 RepID=UPI003EBC4D57
MKKSILYSLFALSFTSGMAVTLNPDVTPVEEGKHIVIHLAQQRMFVYQDQDLKNIYPIAVGKARTRTPIGEYQIGPVAYKPTWSIPKSIQKERAAAGLPAITSIPPGPNNPLGPVFIRFGKPSLGLGIHGTNVPSSVPGVRSHGCVRMKSADALKMAKFVDKGMPVSVIYQLVAVNEDDSGQLWLAAYKDPYNQKNLNRAKLNETLQAWAQKSGVTLNQARIEQTLKAKTGQGVCVSCTNVKGNKVAGSLHSLAWTIGALTHPVPEPTPAVEPESTSEPVSNEIEVNEDF